MSTKPDQSQEKAAPVVSRLLVCLLYLRQHWTMQVIAVALECSEATVRNYIHEMLPYVRQALPASLLEQWQQECPSVERVELKDRGKEAICSRCSFSRIFWL